MISRGAHLLKLGKSECSHVTLCARHENNGPFLTLQICYSMLPAKQYVLLITATLYVTADHAAAATEG